MMTWAAIVLLTASVPAIAAPGCARDHVVQPGDRLESIAAKYMGDTHAHGDIVAASNAASERGYHGIADPSHIEPGWTLCIPGPVAKDSAVVTGVVRVRDASVLPAGLEIRVQVQDVSRADVAATVMGEQILESDGVSAAIPFAVSVDRVRIDRRFSYSVSVRVTDQPDRLRYINTESHPVLTRGGPTQDVEVVVDEVR